MSVEQARFNMIEQQIRPWDVLDPDVLELLALVRREDFVPAQHRALAFVDTEVPLPGGQSMLAPKVEARLLQELTLLAVLLLTSKGAAGITGSGFIVLAATLSAVGTLPVAGLALILGIDRFMSEARALTNFLGNGVATVVVSKWEGELDREKLRAELRG